MSNFSYKDQNEQMSREMTGKEPREAGRWRLLEKVGRKEASPGT